MLHDAACRCVSEHWPLASVAYQKRLVVIVIIIVVGHRVRRGLDGIVRYSLIEPHSPHSVCSTLAWCGE